MDTGFESYIADPDRELGLAEGALLIARDEYPTLNVADYLRRLDSLADDIKQASSSEQDPIALLEAINHKLFTELEFAGNVEHYQDPRNSYLNEVLDRRLGIPITLSVLYVEIGRRLGLTIDGVSFPGHFLVRCLTGDGLIVLDPFYKGASLGEADLTRRLVSAVPGLEEPRAVLARFLASVDHREILARVLRNLRGIFVEQEREDRALNAAHKICLLLPDNAEEIKTRGFLYAKLDCFAQAVDDYSRYLTLAPDAADVDTIRGLVTELAGKVGRMN